MSEARLSDRQILELILEKVMAIEAKADDSITESRWARAQITALNEWREEVEAHATPGNGSGE